MRRIIAYDPAWVEAFFHEAAKLSYWLGAKLVVAHHIGSTSIPNMPAKPIIDLLLEVVSVDELDQISPLFESDGYEVRGEYGIAGRRYFSKKAQNNGFGFHVHAYPSGHREIERHLAFRDYLREKPEVAEEYAALKRALADKNGVLSPDYQEAKAPWVEAVERNAIEHFGYS